MSFELNCHSHVWGICSINNLNKKKKRLIYRRNVCLFLRWYLTQWFRSDLTVRSIAWDEICFGWRLLDLIKPTVNWKLSWCEMTLCLAVLKINDISFIAASWLTDDVEQFIIFTLTQLFILLIFWRCVKLASHPIMLLTNGNIHIFSNYRGQYFVL